MKILEKIIAMAFAFLLSLVLYGSTIEITDNYAVEGDTAIQVSIILDNEQPYAGTEILLEYNSSLLELNRIEPTPRLLDQSENGYYEYSYGHIALITFDLSGIDLSADSGSIFDVYFDIKPEITEGEAIISIPEITAVQSAMEYDSVLVKDGSILIGYSCGNANGDESVNVSDAVYIVNYVFLGGNPPDPLKVGDVNCDDLVNVSDAVWLINYIFIGGNWPCDTNGDHIPDC
jgi:hypothetical protein